MRLTSIYMVFIAVSLLGAAWALGSMEQRANEEYQATTPVFLRLDSDQWNLIGLGQKKVLEHVAYLTLVYNLESAPEQPPIPPSLSEFFDRMTGVGIRNEYLYLMICYSYLFDYQLPSKCMNILTAAYKVHPDSWRIPFTIGFLLTFRMNRPGEAGGYFERASEHDEAPNYLRSLAEKLSTGQQIYIPPRDLKYIEKEMFDKSLLR